MADEHDDFEGIDINGPWGGVRIGSGRMRGRGGFGGDPEYRAVRRRIRRRLDFYRHVATYVVVVGGLALVNWATGGSWWVAWVAGIWGALLALQFVSTFVSPLLWGREVEERMVRRELERRRGRVSVRPATAGDSDPAATNDDREQT
jgi:fatty acid desaturase